MYQIHANLSNVTNEEVDDGCYVTFTFENGLVCYVEVATSNFISLPRWYILGENGTAVIEDWDLNGKIVKIKDWEKIDAVPIKAGAELQRPWHEQAKPLRSSHCRRSQPTGPTTTSTFTMY